MLADKLRKAVLQAAIQGKLTEQLETDGNAADLVAEIKKEKDRLIREKKLKKQKILPEITAEKIPFEIPDNWCWVRLGDIIELLSGRDLVKDDYSDIKEGIPYITGASNFINNSVITNRWTKKPICIALKNDILLTCKGTIGELAIFDKEQAHIARQIMAIRVIKSDVKYIFYYIKSQIDKLKSLGKSIIPGINRENILWYVMPLPPLTEQKRIVKKIEGVLNQIEQLKVNEEKLALLQKNFPDRLKKSLLQAAIQGKLTEQLPSDDNVDDLLAEIREEKEKLIKEKKIKKQKPLPPITAEEILFEIPANWRWVRLGDIGIWEAGSTPNRTNSKYYLNGQVPWVKTGDLNDEILTRVSENITELAVEETAIKLKPIGSILIAMYGATIGKLAILGIKATTNQACCACIPFNGIYNKYLYYYLMSYRDNFKKMGAGGAQPNISREKIIKTLVPLPSLKEQKRIVKQLERFLINIK